MTRRGFLAALPLVGSAAVAAVRAVEVEPLVRSVATTRQFSGGWTTFSFEMSPPQFIEVTDGLTFSAIKWDGAHAAETDEPVIAWVPVDEVEPEWARKLAAETARRALGPRCLKCSGPATRRIAGDGLPAYDCDTCGTVYE